MQLDPSSCFLLTFKPDPFTETRREPFSNEALVWQDLRKRQRRALLSPVEQKSTWRPSRRPCSVWKYKSGREMNDLWLSSQSHSALAKKRLLREMRVNVMKGLCKSYTRSARGNSPSAVWKRLGMNSRAATWLLSGGKWLQSLVAITLAGNYELWKKALTCSCSLLLFFQTCNNCRFES